MTDFARYTLVNFKNETFELSWPAAWRIITGHHGTLEVFDQDGRTHGFFSDVMYFYSPDVHITPKDA